MEILQYKKRDDFVIATGKAMVLENSLKYPFFSRYQNILEGKGLKEIGYDKKTNRTCGIDSKYFRPQEVDHLRGSFKKRKL